MSLFTQPGHASAAELLMDDPRVAGAVSVENIGGRHSVRVLPDPRWLAAQTRHAALAASRSLLGWQTTYDLAYRVPQQAPEPSYAGWIDSFTGRPVPDHDMREWLAAITARLLALPHDRIREIGCGTGLLVRALAPHCRRYDAADFSAVAVAQLQAWLATQPGLRHVRARRQAAHEGGAPAGDAHHGAGFDLVVLNAVAQNFPDADYLRRVLEAAWRDVAPGGHLVIGDVHLLGLHPAMVTASALAGAPDDMLVHALRQAIHETWLAQSDLLLDPAFFHRFAHRAGATVAVCLRPGGGTSEMMRTRCDVLLCKPAMPEGAGTPPAPLDSIGALRRWLASGCAGRVLLRGQPDARLAAEVAAHRLVHAAADSMLVVEVRRLVALQVAADRPAFHPLPRPSPSGGGAAGIDPAAVEALCRAHGCRVLTLATPHATDARFDLLVERGDAASGLPALQPGLEDGPHDDPSLSSQPMLMQSLRQLAMSLRRELARLLPEADMPARILPVVRRDQLVHGALGLGPAAAG